MIPDDIRRSATGMIRNFGPEAFQLAQEMTIKYERQKDAYGVHTWQKIAQAIRLLEQQTPASAA